MDLGFPRMDRLSGRADAQPLDHARLVASLAAAQATTPSARTAMRLGAHSAEQGSRLDALVALFTGGAGWTAALATLEGSFDRDLTARIGRNPA